jgi:hypothetical protein
MFKPLEDLLVKPPRRRPNARGQFAFLGPGPVYTILEESARRFNNVRRCSPKANSARG